MTTIGLGGQLEERVVKRLACRSYFWRVLAAVSAYVARGFPASDLRGSKSKRLQMLDHGARKMFNISNGPAAYLQGCTQKRMA